MKRICVIGDDLVAGIGDPRALGWVGRVIARTRFASAPAVMPLAVPGETTAGLAARWESEVNARISSSDTLHMVVAVGAADVPSGLSTPRSRLNLANIVDRARERGISTLVVGPPPLAGAQQQQLAALDRACAEVCDRRGITYVTCLEPLVAHDQWIADMAASTARSPYELTLPAQAGYALMAYLVLHQGWFEWVDANPMP